MRLLLDAHVSGRRVGRPLRDAGHDVRAVDGEPKVARMEDVDLLELAAHEGRVLVTFDVKDFSRLVKEWADVGRSHSGVVLVPNSIGYDEFGVIIAGTAEALASTSQEDWPDRVQWMRRG